MAQDPLLDEHLAVAPPGWENTVKKMKKHDEIDNPWALAWSMKNKGDKPGGKKEADQVQNELLKTDDLSPPAPEASSRFPDKDPEAVAAVRLAMGREASFTSTYYRLVGDLRELRDEHSMDPERIAKQAIVTLQLEDKKKGKKAKTWNIRTGPQATDTFRDLIMSLEPFVNDLPAKEQHRAKEIEGHALRGFSHATTLEGEEVKEALHSVRTYLTELERLLQGQRQLFARVASESHEVTNVFKDIFDLCDELPDIINLDYMRQVGLKPGPKVDAYPLREKKPRVKAKKTFKQAQDAIFASLKAKGWRVTDHLKIPYAVSPHGDFRFWFKPQAIYYSAGPKVNNFGEARSMWSSDYRNIDTEEFVNDHLMHFAKKYTKV
jgi:hypothetical protein